jgi:Fe-S-cluster containining protein
MVKFTCLRCIHCCFFSSPEECPVLLHDEVERLKSIAAEKGIELEFSELGGGLYRWVIRGYCPFYDVRRRSCSIYRERPSACRMFPLLLNPKSGELSVSRMCDWVEANFQEIINSDPQEVFPEEISSAITVFKRLRENMGKG